MTPKNDFNNSKASHMSFNSIGNQIMRKTDYQVISNKRMFSNSSGLGPVNIGTEDWNRAKMKQERV